MSQSLGQKIIVDNRPGANQSIGAGFVAHSTPDGSTVLISTSGPVTNALNAPVSYDAATAFQPISRVMNSPFFLVVPEKSKLKTVSDLIAAGKDRTQGHPIWASRTRDGDPSSTERLNKMAGTNFIGIPYRGSAGTDLGYDQRRTPVRLARGAGRVVATQRRRLAYPRRLLWTALGAGTGYRNDRGAGCTGIRCRALAWPVCSGSNPSSDH